MRWARLSGRLRRSHPLQPSWHGKRANEPVHGSVVIAAITSCTNTSNPAVMLGAGLLAAARWKRA